MAKGILGTKVGMTQIFAEDGSVIPVTVLQAGPCVVIGKCTPEKQGYSSLRVGFKPVAEKKLTRPEAGVFKKAWEKAKLDPKDAPFLDVVHELRVDPKEAEAFKVGDQLKVDIFRKGQFVDVIGTSKGRGFQGVVKRWRMKGTARNSASAHEVHRHMGAVGQRKTPGKVWKGKHMPGHYGVERITVQNLQVVEIDVENNLLLLRGAVPGHREALVEVYPSSKGKADRPVVKPLEDVDDKKKKAGKR